MLLLQIKKTGRTAWVCQCECGNICIVGTKELRNGDTQSCGCLRDELLTIDLTGQTFGKLTVIERAPNKVKYDGAFWKCICSCGNTTITSGKRLRSGHTQSCGCLISKGEEKIKAFLQKLQINFSQQYSFKDCVTENNNVCRFDFAIFDNNKLLCLIEYDGIQHFEETKFNTLEKNKNRDDIKNNYCKRNNIPLIRIPYTDYDKIDENYLLERINKYV